MERFDAIVIGGGVIGTSIACHLARFGAGSVLLLERGTLGGGTSAQSSCIVRTHYSVADQCSRSRRPRSRSFGIFRTISTTPRPIAGSIACGLMLLAPEGERADALRATLAVCSAKPGSTRAKSDARRSAGIHPLLDFGDRFESSAGSLPPATPTRT